MQTLIIGLDAFDPRVFERLVEQGRMPNLEKYLRAGGYSRFSVSNPPQSEVSWTSIATGLNPGGHGMFDFVHRTPENYALQVSLLPTEKNFSGIQFVPPYRARTIFDQAVRKGYPAVSLWWPATFPARPESPVHTLPGLGTPDIQGRLGVGTFFTTDTGIAADGRKTPVQILKSGGSGRFSAVLNGPVRQKKDGPQDTVLDVQLEIRDENTARLQVGNQLLDLTLGRWSPIVELSFKVGLFFKVHAITRFILTQTRPDVRLYALPLQIHPLRPVWRYASPQSFVKDNWNSAGPFLTIGWPQDTTGLEEGYISDEQFLDLCDSIFRTREKVLLHQLARFREGVIASVFDSLDRIQHMFRRDRMDVVESWYEKLDAMVGRVDDFVRSQKLGNLHRVVVSDHGFAEFDYKVHLNRWLIEKGYLVLKGNGHTAGEDPGLQDVDWARSSAYAIGLNSIYINRAGREGQGSVAPDQEPALVDRLCAELTSWEGPDRIPVVLQVFRREEALDGPLAAYGPDLLVGYAPGYRGSAETGLGSWKAESLEPNRDHWGADHCIHPQAVPGVLFSSRGLKNFPNPSYRDFPMLTVGEKPEAGDSAPPPSMRSSEDAQVVEERLKSLGYF